MFSLVILFIVVFEHVGKAISKLRIARQTDRQTDKQLYSFDIACLFKAFV